jgi:exodeoxyribonuclease III
MRIIAWNVNGLRSLLKTNHLDELMNTNDPDILCFGETKLSCSLTDTDDNIETLIKNKYPKFKYIYWSPCKTRGGYSGTAILSKKKPINAYYGLKYKQKEIDDEGRVITLEYDNYFLIHVYTPNSGQALDRLEFRTKTWDRAFESWMNHLQQSKYIIVAGDLNVARSELDIKNPKTNLRTAGYTIEERDSFEKILLNTDVIDTFRFLNPNLIKYSFWSYRFKSREKNIGWRLDYFLVSKKNINKIKKSDILSNVLGSDHAPIILEI